MQIRGALRAAVRRRSRGVHWGRSPPPVVLSSYTSPRDVPIMMACVLNAASGHGVGGSVVPCAWPTRRADRTTAATSDIATVRWCGEVMMWHWQDVEDRVESQVGACLLTVAAILFAVSLTSWRLLRRLNGRTAALVSQVLSWFAVKQGYCVPGSMTRMPGCLPGCPQRACSVCGSVWTLSSEEKGTNGGTASLQEGCEGKGVDRGA